jgi:protein-S-isoprenylcysteine O-methyltransferase Ste14
VKLRQAFLELERRTDPNPRGWAIVAAFLGIGVVLALATAWELEGIRHGSHPPSWIPLIGAVVLGVCAVGACWRLVRDHKRLGSIS